MNDPNKLAKNMISYIQKCHIIIGRLGFLGIFVCVMSSSLKNMNDPNKLAKNMISHIQKCHIIIGRLGFLGIFVCVMSSSIRFLVIKLI
jgi:acetylglutamate synthase